VKRPAFTALAAFLSFALLVASAHASYTPPMLVSYTGSLEADDAYSPAISADGRYVAFAGSFDGVSGVYRKDLQTGELALVAGADTGTTALSAPDAGSPSISGDGRYVSFTTTASLVPDDPAGGCSSVYVRDMDTPIAQPGAYQLASALDGSDVGITYAGSGTPGCPGGGSASADRVALSEAGTEVAFTVVGQSNLTSAGGGGVETPGAQVAVRNLETDTTTLVSQTIGSLGSAAPEAVPGGAAITSAHDALEAEGRQLSGSTAAISADGSTVAWMGIDVPSQAPAASGDGGEYDEPLWRRIADGPDAPIRRVTGGDDPLCGCAGPLDTDFDTNPSSGGGPESGSYVESNGFDADPLVKGAESLEAVTPQLSANGQTVAILSTQPRTGEVSKALEEELAPSTANAFVVDMADGLTRAQALTQLTAWASDNFRNTAGAAAVDGIAISPDGTRVAFTTARIEFPLSPPALLTPALGQVPEPQLYVANLATGTLSLVSYGYGGEPANGTVASPAFAGDGETLVFSSSATNLVYGAYNKGNAQGQPGNVFVTSEVSSPAVPGIQTIAPLPPGPLAAPSRELLVTARPGPHGTVLLYVTVPAAGKLTASARSRVPVAIYVKRKGKRARTIVANRVVASASATAEGAGLVELRLTSASAYRSLVRARDGLYATISLRFVQPGQTPLASTVQASFHGDSAVVATKARKPANRATKSAHKTSEAVKPASAAKAKRP
jgi:hypothetical protein